MGYHWRVSVGLHRQVDADILQRKNCAAGPRLGLYRNVVIR